MNIPFNKPFLTGNEIRYIKNAVQSLKICGDGIYSEKCHEFFEKRYGLRKVLLTTSCTDALEMAALLLNIKDGDEVIVPSYTFVSTVNPFVLRGARIIFADSLSNHPNIDHDQLEPLITNNTRAIVPVHYAGVACEMDAIMSIAEKYNLYVVEDAAQAVDSYYKGKPLGSIGHFGAYSFHETKNVICGEGGMLVINDESFIERAEIIREKGTNRSQFHRGEVNKYEWMDIGSSFLPSDIIAAFLYAQLEKLDKIQAKRKNIWNKYNTAFNILEEKGKVKLPVIPNYASNNAHLYFLITTSVTERDAFIEFMRAKNINPVFHYLSLHQSPFFKDKYRGMPLKQADYYSSSLIRLPLYYSLTTKEVNCIISSVLEFYGEN